jgi:hypothetical protein
MPDSSGDCQLPIADLRIPGLDSELRARKMNHRNEGHSLDRRFFKLAIGNWQSAMP